MSFGDIVNDYYIVHKDGTRTNIYHQDDGWYIPKEVSFEFNDVKTTFNNLLNVVEKSNDYISIPVRHDDIYIMETYGEKLDSTKEYVLDIDYYGYPKEYLWEILDANNRSRRNVKRMYKL